MRRVPTRGASDKLLVFLAYARAGPFPAWVYGMRQWSLFSPGQRLYISVSCSASQAPYAMGRGTKGRIVPGD